MKVITDETDDVYEVEQFVTRMYRRIPVHWQRILPAWCVVVTDHSRTLRFVPALQLVIRQFGFDARNFSTMAGHADDWWSVHLILQSPNEKNPRWVVWVRHSHDRISLGQDFLTEVGAILWGSNAHLRALWIMSAKQGYKLSSEDEIVGKFCDGFGRMMYDRRQFFMTYTPLTAFFGDLEKKILQGSLSLELGS
jgi:hypothetical protein